MIGLGSGSGLGSGLIKYNGRKEVFNNLRM